MSTAPKENAAPGVGARNGGKGKSRQRNDKAKGRHRASLKLVPAWNDDGHLSGWIGVGEFRLQTVEART